MPAQKKYGVPTKPLSVRVPKHLHADLKPKVSKYTEYLIKGGKSIPEIKEAICEVYNIYSGIFDGVDVAMLGEERDLVEKAETKMMNIISELYGNQ